ncbi:hypothetical protein ACFL2O_07945 [Thermodesulfobacteriota bacterium]
MVKSIIRIVAIILNFGITAFILGLALRESLEFDNINSYVFIAVAMVTPLVNISALLGKPAFIKPLIALLVNTLVLTIFSFIILLVMIWPMGSKPHGMEIVYIFSLYSALLFTELSHILKIKKKQTHSDDQGNGS